MSNMSITCESFLLEEVYLKTECKKQFREKHTIKVLKPMVKNRFK